MAEALQATQCVLLTLMVLGDALHCYVTQGKMTEGVVGGVSGELSLLCDFGQVPGARRLWDSFLVSERR